MESVFVILNFEYLSEKETHWLVAKAGSNDEKKLGVQNVVGLFLSLQRSSGNWCFQLGIAVAKLGIAVATWYCHSYLVLP